MSSESWKLEKDLCRCCHSEGSFKNLSEPAQSGGLVEIYTDMLNECFDIDMAPVPGLLSAATYTICEICIIRLRDASEFKKQVLTCEERFKDLYNKNIIRASTTLISVEVKQELPEVDVEAQDTFKVEVSQDEDDDDDYNEPIDIQISEEEDIKPAKVEVPKKRKCKAKKTVKPAKKCVPTKKTKRKSVKVDKADEENDDEAEKKQERVVTPRFYVKYEDYKKVGDVYHCARCDKTYSGLHSLTWHVKQKHYQIPRFKCSVCNDKFMTLPPLRIHKLEVHNIDDRVKCNVCDKKFNTEIQLKNHLKFFHMHGDVGKRYTCEFCDYVCFHYAHMYKHKFKHKTVKDYHCKFCKKAFKRKTTLDFHERIHTGDRRKVCAECGQAFVQKASLNYHMTKYHPEGRLIIIIMLYPPGKKQAEIRRRNFS
ncbi:hypothetical protein PYW08_012715 [Mythimna loreyi]|uniref:Uncharacterized protein n=1 Tax=Mythimna loreyi TaxID=667449 RepID=A0ACC2Q2U4_9NEOP|nr:hypothetical protein PYW08_012715 [Mythimna loreyi]